MEGTKDPCSRCTAGRTVTGAACVWCRGTGIATSDFNREAAPRPADYPIGSWCRVLFQAHWYSGVVLEHTKTRVLVQFETGSGRVRSRPFSAAGGKIAPPIHETPLGDPPK